MYPYLSAQFQVYPCRCILSQPFYISGCWYIDICWYYKHRNNCFCEGEGTEFFPARLSIWPTVHWFLNLQWTCLRQMCILGSCAFSEGPALGQNTMMLSSIERRKQRRRPDTLAPCMGTIPSERAQQENGSLFKEEHFWHYWHSTFRKTFGVWWRSFKQLLHNDPRQCIRELANMMNCDHSTIVRHFHSMAKFKKIGCMRTAWSKPKPQKSGGGHKCIFACLSSIGSWTTLTIPILYLYWWREMMSSC